MVICEGRRRLWHGGKFAIRKALAALVKKGRAGARRGSVPILAEIYGILRIILYLSAD